jgi:hypothetical protein
MDFEQRTGWNKEGFAILLFLGQYYCPNQRARSTRAWNGAGDALACVPNGAQHEWLRAASQSTREKAAFEDMVRLGCGARWRCGRGEMCVPASALLADVRECDG